MFQRVFANYKIEFILNHKIESRLYKKYFTSKLPTNKEPVVKSINYQKACEGVFEFNGKKVLPDLPI